MILISQYIAVKNVVIQIWRVIHYVSIVPVFEPESLNENDRSSDQGLRSKREVKKTVMVICLYFLELGNIIDKVDDQ